MFLGGNLLRPPPRHDLAAFLRRRPLAGCDEICRVPGGRGSGGGRRRLSEKIPANGKRFPDNLLRPLLPFRPHIFQENNHATHNENCLFGVCRVSNPAAVVPGSCAGDQLYGKAAADPAHADALGSSDEFLGAGRGHAAGRWPMPRWVTVLILAMYGGATEIIQGFVPPRTPRWGDWFQDVGGVTVGVTVCSIAAFLLVRIFPHVGQLVGSVPLLRGSSAAHDPLPAAVGQQAVARGGERWKLDRASWLRLVRVFARTVGPLK